VDQILFERYRSSEMPGEPLVRAPLSGVSAFFRFAGGTVYGEHLSASSSGAPPYEDLTNEIEIREGRLSLPFDPARVVENLTHERYCLTANGSSTSTPPEAVLRRLYYLLRPLLPVSIRAVAQRLYLRDWNTIAFPAWPVDVTVEDLIEHLLFLSMQAAGVTSLPFIWFWPDGASCATILTHDVETAAGRDFCDSLMAIDESFGFRASYQIVPQERYAVTEAFLAEIRARGHVVNVQDLNHDGHLFRSRAEFFSRAKLINGYGRAFGARGFRSAVLYRNLNWYDQLDFEYDMSVPNVGHLEAQRGGCCTVFPFFIGRILELPVTTTQDYALFHILRDYSLDVWKAQAARVEAKHGLLSFIAHPDYLEGDRPQDTYRALLTFLAERRQNGGAWVTTSDAVNEWWRQRSQMTLVRRNGTLEIDGPGKERARIAWAEIEGNRVVYTHPK
jgi:hypothetical protein